MLSELWRKYQHGLEVDEAFIEADPRQDEVQDALDSALSFT